MKQQESSSVPSVSSLSSLSQPYRQKSEAQRHSKDNSWSVDKAKNRKNSPIINHGGVNSFSSKQFQKQSSSSPTKKSGYLSLENRPVKIGNEKIEKQAERKIEKQTVKKITKQIEQKIGEKIEKIKKFQKKFERQNLRQWEGQIEKLRKAIKANEEHQELVQKKVAKVYQTIQNWEQKKNMIDRQIDEQYRKLKNQQRNLVIVKLQEEENQQKIIRIQMEINSLKRQIKSNELKMKKVCQNLVLQQAQYQKAWRRYNYLRNQQDLLVADLQKIKQNKTNYTLNDPQLQK